VVAARARAVYAAKHGTTYTGSIASKSTRGAQKPGQPAAAVPGADGLDEDDTTGSIAAKAILAGEDGEFDDDDVTASIPEPKPAATGWPRLAPQSSSHYRPDANPAGR
jgi:hypothetical protein